MSSKTTIIAAVVAAALAVYIYVYEREPVESDTDSEREELFDFEAEAVREVEIRRTDGDGLKIAKSDESWRILEPVEVLADSTEASSLARNIANLERERIVSEGADVNLEEFGLSRPVCEVRFKTEGQDNLTTILFGDETPTGSANVYAKLADDNRILIVPSYMKNNLDKTVWDLRDKKVLHFETDGVEKLILRKPEGEFALSRDGEDRWMVTSDSVCRADRYKASSLVSRLDTARMEEIVSEDSEDVPQDLEDYGLAKPAYEVEIQLEGETSAKLQVGRKTDGRFYARDTERPMVFLVGSSLVDEITKDPSEYLSKRLFDFATYQAVKLQIATAEGETQVVEKTKEGEDGQERWHETAPRSRELDRNKVEDLLYKLNGTDADDFAAEGLSDLEPFGLDEPAFKITVWSKEGETVEELSVGKPEGDWTYALRKGDEVVLMLEASSWEAIEKLMSFEEEEEKKGG